MKLKKLGANGVLSIDFETAEILEGFILVAAYGTAVKLRKTATQGCGKYQKN